MASHELENMFSSTLNGLRDMIDVNTIIGNPIETADGMTIIPVSKVSFGFAMGGWDNTPTIEEQSVIGGSGGGVSVSPVGFLVVGNGNIKMLNVDSTTSLEKLIESIPEIAKTLGSMFRK